MAMIWVFGATGLSGRAIADELVVSGADVMYRRARRRRAFARAPRGSMGGPVGQRVVRGPAELAELIRAEKPGVVVNAVGPYGATAPPLPSGVPGRRDTLRRSGQRARFRCEQLLELDADARSRGVTLRDRRGVRCAGNRGAGDRVAQRPAPGSARRRSPPYLPCRGLDRRCWPALSTLLRTAAGGIGTDGWCVGGWAPITYSIPVPNGSPARGALACTDG